MACCWIIVSFVTMASVKSMILLIYVGPIFKFFSIFYKMLYRILSYDFFLEVIEIFVKIAAVKVTVY